MEREKEEVLGSFLAVDNEKIIRRVVITQEVSTYYSGEKIHSKNFYLDKVHGEKILKTEHPKIFILADGTVLKRK